MNKKLSVVIPVYNIENYLSKCLDSVINQTLQDIEIICVNDGSTDNSSEILEKYSKKDSRIMILNKENGGLSSARNEGLKYVTTDYVAFLDSDDWVEPETYELAYNAMITNDTDLVCFYANIVTEDNFMTPTLLENAQNYHKIRRVGNYKANDELLVDMTVTAWNKLYKTKIIKNNNIKFPQGLLFEDNEFFFEYGLFCKNIYFLDKYLYNYLQRSNSIMGNVLKKTGSKITDRIKIGENLYNYYVQNALFPIHEKLFTQLFSILLSEEYIHSISKNKQKVLDFTNQVVKNFDLSYFTSDPNLFKNILSKKYYKIPFLNIKKYPLSNIFSVENVGFYKIIKLLGLKIKIKNKKKLLKHEFLMIEDRLDKLEKINNRQSRINNLLIGLMNENIQTITEKIKDRKINLPFYDTNIIEELNKLKDFYFFPNNGNLGDVVIAEAEYQMLENNNFNYSVFNIYETPSFPENLKFDLVYGGGGLFVKYWDYENVLTIFKKKNFKNAVILPSSFMECDDLMDVLDERFTVFCREKRSYDYCVSKNTKAKFILSNDMAFSLDTNLSEYRHTSELKSNVSNITLENIYSVDDIFNAYKTVKEQLSKDLKIGTHLLENGTRVGYFLRKDKESNLTNIPQNSVDLSSYVWTSCTDRSAVGLLTSIFIDAIKTVDIVLTDRLHVGITAALLNKKVFLIDNAYGKLSAVLDQSMSTNKNVIFIKNIEEFDINTSINEVSTAKLSFISEESVSYLDFIKKYFAYKNYDQNNKNTIWE